jgi:choline dehydrogenase-like flavoprotein
MVDEERYDLVLVGSSFASTFFLHKYLQLAGSGRRRVLVLERGEARSWQWLAENENRLIRESLDTLVHDSGDKQWGVRIAVGGASNSWWACSPRLLPEDFELATRYGVGADWPVTYDDLELYYCEAEEIMAVSGSEDSPCPRSRPFPQPPHRFSLPDQILKRRWAEEFVAQPNARARVQTPRGRAACCGAGVCNRCPADAKFTVINELDWLLADPRVELLTGANATAVDVEGDRAAGVVFERRGRTERARAEFVALGASAIFNPFLLLKSGLDGPEVGKGLCEQQGLLVAADLDGIDNFQGSSAITGHAYPFYGGSHRSKRAACLIETWNKPEVRDERGKYRHYLKMKLILEEFRRSENRVEVSREDPDKPVAIYRGPSENTRRTMNQASSMVDTFLAPLPLEGPPRMWAARSEDHILGTAVMGDDPATSVVDRALRHHRVRNLAVLGGSAFPTAAPANPTLTIGALSLWAAEQTFGRAGI